MSGFRGVRNADTTIAHARTARAFPGFRIRPNPWIAAKMRKTATNPPAYWYPNRYQVTGTGRRVNTNHGKETTHSRRARNGTKTRLPNDRNQKAARNAQLSGGLPDWRKLESVEPTDRPEPAKYAERERIEKREANDKTSVAKRSSARGRSRSKRIRNDRRLPLAVLRTDNWRTRWASAIEPTKTDAKSIVKIERRKKTAYHLHRRVRYE